MPYTQTDLDSLKSALAAGVRRVMFKDRSVEYNTTAELIQAIDIVQAELNQQNGIKSSRQVRIYASKGFGRHW